MEKVNNEFILQMMDITKECPGVKALDKVSLNVRPGTVHALMGENGGASITATEVAEKRGTINYEVLCLLSDRVPRSYD